MNKSCLDSGWNSFLNSKYRARSLDFIDLSLSSLSKDKASFGQSFAKLLLQIESNAKDYIR